MVLLWYACLQGIINQSKRMKSPQYAQATTGTPAYREPREPRAKTGFTAGTRAEHKFLIWGSMTERKPAREDLLCTEIKWGFDSWLLRKHSLKGKLIDDMLQRGRGWSQGETSLLNQLCKIQPWTLVSHKKGRPNFPCTRHYELWSHCVWRVNSIRVQSTASLSSTGVPTL